MADPSATTTPTANLYIAERFREAADLLEAQEASPFRVRAYRRGASTLTRLDRSIADLYEQNGREGLRELPTIGVSLSNAIAEILETGKWRFLQRLQGAVGPESVFQQIATIGPELAERIHDQLEIETLEELEQAAHDGRLDDVEGFGRRRVQAVRDSVGARLQRQRAPDAEVPVSELLDVDEEYRRRAAAGQLYKISPRRFNPKGEAWLPILHTERGDRYYTALFSNTPRAHELDKTDDWVILYREDGEQEQWTVVTETSGPLEGRRVVRGREAECQAYYENQSDASDAERRF